MVTFWLLCGPHRPANGEFIGSEDIPRYAMRNAASGIYRYYRRVPSCTRTITRHGRRRGSGDERHERRNATSL
ncbi:hypothetical protein CN070_11500 [Sinorhizobium meliloti]|nr:hypothetical protein CN070_11500 [Sinorhizobium meliloti]